MLELALSLHHGGPELKVLRLGVRSLYTLNHLASPGWYAEGLTYILPGLHREACGSIINHRGLSRASSCSVAEPSLQESTHLHLPALRSLGDPG